MRKFSFLLAALLMLMRTGSHAQSYRVHITLADTTIISSINSDGKPTFTIAGMNTIINGYTVTGFTKTCPDSRFQIMRQEYQMEVSDTAVCTLLVSSYPLFFSKWGVYREMMTLGAYYPSDHFDRWPVRTSFLDYINAPDAWGVTHGDANVVIGISDTWLDVTHPDLQTKIAQVSQGGMPTGSSQQHGTEVTGAAVARTHNGTEGYSSIGFNCRVDFSTMGHIQMRKMSLAGRRIVNASWMEGGAPDLNIANYGFQSYYQEMYENGTFTCVSAGNKSDGGADIPWHYTYPASYDYVMSTSGVGWENDYGTASAHVKGLHQFENYNTDSNNSWRHNSRVDILAPAWRVGCITFDSADVNHNYNWDSFWGTSIASPITAGTAGLILSVNQCYTPYQLEYILKKSANDSILSLPENLKYTGRLGAGALDAGNALAMVDTNQLNIPKRSAPKIRCNDAASQTFYIEGVDINTICAPGFSSNSVNPVLTPVLRNGTPNYTYLWEPQTGNTATLNSYTSASPTITAATLDGFNNRVAYFRLTVYDGSEIQKVASKYIKLKLSTRDTFDLAGADSYMDMFDEPNNMTALDPREWSFYESPDLWNRQLNDGVPTHQNPEYFTSAPNYAHVKIRNVGCAAYTGGSRNLKLYWTVASTGENWKEDWDGTTYVCGAGGGVMPGGGEITTTVQGDTIPNLQPGQSTVMVKSWYPPLPTDYCGVTDKLNVCLLARIIRPANTWDYGMTIKETYFAPVLGNVKNNNNIFTRNLWVFNANSSNRNDKIRVYVANAGQEAGIFDVQFINDRSINLHFAGNFSEIGYVTLYLGDLYDIWMNEGGDGSYISRDDENKTVTMDGSQTLELLNLPLEPGMKYPVDVEFTIDPNVVIPDYRFDFHLRQFEVLGGERSNDVYGGMSFRVNTVNDGGIGRKAAQPDKDVLNETASAFSVHPNPASDKISVSYLSKDEVVVNVEVFDVTGRKLTGKENQHFQNSFIELNVADYAPGVYFVNISNGKNIKDRIKFIKR